MITSFIVQAVAGWLLADFIGAFVHWWMDRVAFDSDTMMGRQVVAPNRLHHSDPTAFLAGDLFSRNSTTWAAVGVVSIVMLALTGPSVVWASATLGGLVMTEVHRMAHLPRQGGPLVRIAQEIGLIQSVRHHATHHKSPSDVRYCILTNWVNPVLDELRFWHRLERLLTRLGFRLSLGAA